MILLWQLMLKTKNKLILTNSSTNVKWYSSYFIQCYLLKDVYERLRLLFTIPVVYIRSKYDLNA